MRRTTLLLACLALAAGCHRAQAEPAPTTPSTDGADRVAQADEATSQPTSMPGDEAGHDEEDDHGDHGGGTPGNQPDGSTMHYGAPFEIDGDPITLTEAIATCADTGDACKVTGTVDRVCQARGCWFTLSDPAVEQVVRIRMQDYGFFVPRNAMGMTVVFEGTLERQEVPQDVAQHYADDEAAATGQPARQVTGPEDAWQFMISGAEITAP